MKILITAILILITLATNAQGITIDSCGLNNSEELNKCEVQYFNQTFKKQKPSVNYDFNNKRIAFAYGNFGNGIISKKEYFDNWGREYYKSGSRVFDILLILTQEEKIKSGGYDAIVVSWSKTGVFGKHRTRLIEELKKQNGS